MATLEKIKERISEIAQRRNNVTLSDIAWVVRQLGEHGYKVDSTDAKHGKLFQVGTRSFMVNHHNPGQKQVKSYSVKDFVEAMTELELYE